MKKQVRTLIIISVTVLLLVGLLLALIFLMPEKDDDENTSSTTSNETTIDVVSKTTDDEGNIIDQPVKKAVIKNQAEYEISENKDKKLAVKGYEDLPVNESEIDLLTSNLASLTASRKVADDSSNAAEFGLDKPRATAEVTFHDDTVIKYELGNDAVGDLGCYIRIEENGPIYLVNSSFADYLLNKPEVYIGTILITPPETKTDSDSSDTDSSNDTAVLRSLKLSGSFRKDSPFEIAINEKPDNKDWFSIYSYLITSPIKKGVRDNFNSTAQTLTSLHAIEAVKAHPTSEQLKEYGLDNPYSIAEMTLAVQSSKTTDDDKTITTFYNSTKHVVKLGKKDKDGNYYALVNDINAVYLLSDSAVPWVEMRYNEVATELLFLRDIQTIKTVEVEVNGKNTKFDITHFPDEEDRDKNMTVEIDGKKYSTEHFRDFYQVLMSIKRYGESDKKPSGNPEVVIKVIPDKASEAIVAKYYKLSPSIYICAMSDGDIFTVKASDIDKLKIALDDYLNGREIKEIF
jgi:flagellar basal body-associated protein FliL